MAADQGLIIRVRECRLARGWSQADLAARAGLSRAGVSAIETGRLTPSTAAALALASALGRRVEDLFLLADAGDPGRPAWAWSPASEPARFWEARVGPRLLRYPVEGTAAGTVPHDGVWRDGRARSAGSHDPGRTLILAGCDPAVALLATVAARQEGLRIIPVTRSSDAALSLLGRGAIHVAGVHLNAADDAGGNAAAVRERLGGGYRLLAVARWEEGLAVAVGRRLRSVGAALSARLRWIAREPGSGARQCLDELLGSRTPRLPVARDHRGVSEAIRCGYAEAGVCLRLVSEEAGLRFLPVRAERYDLCFAAGSAADWRIEALRRVVRSREYRRLLRDLPGYDPRCAGDVQPIA